MIKVALAHDYLVHIRGGERILYLLSDLFPAADIYTLVCDPRIIPHEWNNRRLNTSFIQRLPFAKKFFRAWLPLYPYAVEQFDLKKYDLVISCSSGFVHGVITQPGTCHICYSLSPLRYAWNWYYESIADTGPLSAFLLRVMLHWVRQWDRQAADRVDDYVAISQVTQRRLLKYYRRDSVVINPPIETSLFGIAEEVDDFFLIVSALMPYKRVDIAVNAFNSLGLPLKIVGTGPELGRLRKMAKSNIEFLGRIPDHKVRQYYSRCRAFIFTAEEDYGITPLEAQASGRPVIAYGTGGVLETVVNGLTGAFFQDQTADSLAEAVSRFDSTQFAPLTIREHATKFDVSVFKKKMTSFVQASLAKYRSNFGLIPLE